MSQRLAMLVTVTTFVGSSLAMPVERLADGIAFVVGVEADQENISPLPPRPFRYRCLERARSRDWRCATRPGRARRSPGRASDREPSVARTLGQRAVTVPDPAGDPP